jgi:hypothetical protein
MRNPDMRCAVLIGCITISWAVPLFATTIRSVKIADLFKEADVVAEVKIVSGDGESYPGVVYKARVVTAYKGAAANATLYFGPLESFGIGSKYIVFLTRSGGPIVPLRSASHTSYGTIPNSYEIMYAGYAILPSGYECVFDGGDLAQQCDDSIQLNPNQIVLPENIGKFPVGDAGPITNYRIWVHKRDLTSLLVTLSAKK